LFLKKSPPFLTVFGLNLGRITQNQKIIASSDNKDLFSKFSLNTNGLDKGHYINDQNDVIAFSRTIGYQEYDGLGWYCVIIKNLS
jgi:hypothetical protein